MSVGHDQISITDSKSRPQKLERACTRALECSDTNHGSLHLFDDGERVVGRDHLVFEKHQRDQSQPGDKNRVAKMRCRSSAHRHVLHLSGTGSQKW